jgi:phage shock protein A
LFEAGGLAVVKAILDNAQVVNQTADYLSMKFNICKERGWSKTNIEAFNCYGDELLRDGLYEIWIMIVEGKLLNRQYNEGQEMSPRIPEKDYVDSWFCSLLCGRSNALQFGFPDAVSVFPQGHTPITFSNCAHFVAGTVARAAQKRLPRRPVTFTLGYIDSNPGSPAVRSTNKDIGDELCAMKAMIKKLSTQIAETKRTENAVPALRNQVRALTTEVTALRDAETTRKNQVRALRAEVADLKDSKAALHRRVAALNNEVSHLSRETARKDQVRALRAEIADLKACETAIHNQVTAPNNEVSHLRREVRSSEARSTSTSRQHNRRSGLSNWGQGEYRR